MSFAPPGVQPGQAPLDQGQQSALAATLAKVGPPNNPKTLAERTNPQYQWLSRLHSIRKALDECIQESLDDRSPDEQVLIVSMRHASDRLLKGVAGADTSMNLAAEVTESLAPQIAQQARAQLDQLSRPPQVPGAPQVAGIVPPGPPQGGPPGMPPGGPPAAPPMGGGVQPPSPG